MMTLPPKEVFPIFSKCLQIVSMLALGVLNIFAPFSFFFFSILNQINTSSSCNFFFLKATADISHENKIHETFNTT